MTMQYYPYTIRPGQPPQEAGNDLAQTRFGHSAIASAPQAVSALDPWPTGASGILVANMPDDAVHNLDAAASTWMDAAAPGQKLEVLYRGLRLLWKSGRAFAQGPEPLVAAALAATLDYALLAQQINVLDARASALGDALQAWQGQPERSGDITAVRAQLAEATALSLRLVDLRPFCEVPARTGDAGPTLRLRTELLSQAQTSDALGLIEHRLEIVIDGLENRLQRAQEARRGRFEAAIGVIIVVILIAEFLIQ